MSKKSSDNAKRSVSRSRKTGETDIRATINLDGAGQSSIATGIGFFDHMLTALSKHSRIDIDLACKGDVETVDDHHSVEDCAIVLGQCIDEALGDRSGIARFGYAYAPLDEALARCVIDLSGRGCAVVNLSLACERIGPILAAENLTHFAQTLALNLKAAIHLDVLRGENNHHKAEAAFKALALALRMAVAKDAGAIGVPSTKGVLTQ